jgi:hypothetical protein
VSSINHSARNKIKEALRKYAAIRKKSFSCPNTGKEWSDLLNHRGHMISFTGNDSFMGTEDLNRCFTRIVTGEGGPVYLYYVSGSNPVLHTLYVYDLTALREVT